MLDNPIWSALSTYHRSFAQGNELALRYIAPVGPLSAIREQSTAAYEALGQLLGNEEAAALFLESTPQLPHGWKNIHEVCLLQMVDESVAAVSEGPREVELLSASDLPEMLALTQLTQPGPFRERTIELGRYYGIRHEGKLVAMAGERLQMPGFTEVSAVCTHPDHRGRGYAAILISTVVRGLRSRGITPMLHVREGNASAIRLYEHLGFSVRRSFHLVVARR